MTNQITFDANIFAKAFNAGALSAQHYEGMSVEDMAALHSELKNNYKSSKKAEEMQTVWAELNYSDEEFKMIFGQEKGIVHASFKAGSVAEVMGVEFVESICGSDVSLKRASHDMKKVTCKHCIKKLEEMEAVH